MAVSRNPKIYNDKFLSRTARPSMRGLIAEDGVGETGAGRPRSRSAPVLHADCAASDCGTVILSSCSDVVSSLQADAQFFCRRSGVRRMCVPFMWTKLASFRACKAKMAFS